MSGASDISISPSIVSVSDHLPLRLVKSETIPPAVNVSETRSTFDWLPDFGGYSWIAYGASSLLVISHFPSPLSPQETNIGPVFRQVLELCSHNSCDVTSVSWSPSMPSQGDLAAAAGNRIWLFTYSSAEGSFCWSQTALLGQSVKVEAIKWTGSGDGIIAGGIEVVLWKRNARSWEIAWKFGMRLAQTLVSTTWSIDGPSASGSYPSELHAEGLFLTTNAARNCVTVCHNVEKYGYAISELQHPQPVLAIQWRPSRGTHLSENVGYKTRHVLLTCCLDGTVRLWTEIGDGRVQKSTKDINGPKTSRRSFCVIAVIEINQALNGTLGTTIFVSWPIELGGIICSFEGPHRHFSPASYKHDKVGRCEWLIGLGPGTLVTFWAVHCLDDIAPMRPPRVTLWKRRELLGSTVRSFHDINQSNPLGTSSGFIKGAIAAVWRNQLFGPPVLCSLVQLSPCCSLGWSLLYNKTSAKIEDRSSNKSDTDSYLSHDSRGVLNIDGHTGKVLHVALHPCKCDIELAVSLDSNGLLLFWSISTSSNCISGFPTLNPSWKSLGKLILEDLSPCSVSLNWAPSWLDVDRILLIGHTQGIDCVIIRPCESKEEKILYHKLCTIPFSNGGPTCGPDKLSSIPLHSTCKKTFNFNHFMLIGLWIKDFQALSWIITLHSYDLSGSCSECNIDDRNNGEYCTWVFESEFADKRYSIVVNPCSSYLPDSSDDVTSVAVVNPSIVMPSLLQTLDTMNDFCPTNFAYHVATGHSDGRLRLWRSTLQKLSASRTLWELVGVLTAHQGPVTAIALADYGQKIAMICSASPNTVDMIFVWEPVYLAGVGCFALEDTINVNGHAVALSWLVLGTGQLFLGVCLQNELHVYAQRRMSGQSLLNMEKPSEASLWFCIAIADTLPAIFNFLWGPRGTTVVVHEKYFSVFSHWSFLTNEKTEDHHPQDNSSYCTSESAGGILPSMSAECEAGNLEKLSLAEGSKLCMYIPALMMEREQISSSVFSEGAQTKDAFCPKIGSMSMFEVAEKLCGPLPFYHPEVLWLSIFSGNWKRAHAAMQYLVESFASASAGGPISKKSCPSIRQIKLSNYLEGLVSTGEGAANRGFEWTRKENSVTLSSYSEKKQLHFGNNSVSDAWNNSSASSVSRSESSVFLETLEKLHALAVITDSQKAQTFAIVNLLHEISNSQSSSAYESLDEPGKRFWCSVRLQQLDFHRRCNRMPCTEELVIDSRMIAWAFHSDCQENLLSVVSPMEASWNEMRNMGIGFWFADAAQLRTKMEKLARFQYLKSKDPKACTLLYIALNRIQVLAGLFKISKDEKDKPLVGFLSRNFQEEKNKAAALKNAYVLMGRHQLELAISFFLLGGDTMSAVTVCAKTLGDEQLALVICRLVEGQGGPLERYLISKIILPSAIEKGDYWLCSVLEWVLGNYCQSLLILLDFQGDSHNRGSTHLFKHAASFDPNIGQYCQMLIAKNSLRNAVGEQNSTLLYRWAIVKTANVLNKCGFPLEALECLSSSSSTIGDAHQGVDEGNSEILTRILKLSSADSSNRVSGEVAFLLENQAKSDLAMQYISKLILEHPSWLNTTASNKASASFQEYDLYHYGAQLERFQEKFNFALAYVEQKFSLPPHLLLNKILVSLSNNGLLFLGCHILCGSASQDHFPKLSQTVSFILYQDQLKQLLDAAKELSYLVSRFVTACSIASSFSMLSLPNHDESVAKGHGFSHVLGFYMQGLSLLLYRIRAALLVFYDNSTKDLITLSFVVLDLCTYCVYMASAKLEWNLEALALLVQPLSISFADRHNCQTGIDNLREILCKIEELMGYKSLDNARCRSIKSTESIHCNRGRGKLSMIPEDEKWKIIEMYLWQHVSRSITNKINQLSDKLGNFCIPSNPAYESAAFPEHFDNQTLKPIHLTWVVLAESIGNTVAHISSYHARQLAIFLWLKVREGAPVPTLLWLEEFSQSQPRGVHEHLSSSSTGLGAVNAEASLLCSESLWNICSDPSLIIQVLARVGIELSEVTHWKPLRGWRDLYTRIIGESEKKETYNQESVSGRSSAASKTGSPALTESHIVHSQVDSDKKESDVLNNVVPFQNPREIYRRNGELFEALCINSVDQQAALASNRKGIIFFNWVDELPFGDQSNYIWSEVDWPRNGWAGTESTPLPTCVSPGLGLGNNKGLHLGLGGATIGAGSLARPGRHLTGGGAFGIPGYAGISASGLEWEIQEAFDNLVDLPATLESVIPKALASHPSRPFFLVGSSNTHIYLWEFGKDTAAATYGVLPAAEVPPPYALASVMALKFDSCGHRFANAASDGTVATWQLEVGGRSNVRPTESSLCFNGQALDVSYVAASGSVIAVAGYSSDGVNVVVWDTLAPPATSRASIMCHEGGACSIAVFDNNVGSSSVSPLIVSGGKGGDVGLHDFRYMATGKSKRHRHHYIVDRISDPLAVDVQSGLSHTVGDQNQNGMLWYIPKAHSGRITRICTIPDTSLFLTGSQDGDVKLWDAKRNSLVFHWPKLHEKHTFLQRSSHGFGGVARVAVTDIEVVSNGFLTCGGDGSVKLVQLKDFASFPWKRRESNLALANGNNESPCSGQKLVAGIERTRRNLSLCSFDAFSFHRTCVMAAAEARAALQRTANRCFVQEDAKRAPKLACCQPSPSSSKQVDAGPTNAADEPDHPSPNFGHERGLTFDQLNALEVEMETSGTCILNTSSKVGEVQPWTKESTDVVSHQNINTHLDEHSNASSTMKHPEVKCEDLNATKGKTDQDILEVKDMTDYYEFMERELIGSSVSKETGELSFNSDSPWIGAEKVPWWRITDKDKLASLVAQKSLHHIENCDLPPPQKMHVMGEPYRQARGFNWDGMAVFSQDFKTQSDAITGVSLGVSPNSAGVNHWTLAKEVELEDLSSKSTTYCAPTDKARIYDGDPSQAQLLEALCHSQTRAREAEKAAKQAYTEKEHVVQLFFRQATLLFAYKQWFKLLQLESLCLQIKDKDPKISTPFPILVPWTPFKPRKLPESWQKATKVKRRKHDIGKYAVAIAVGLSLVGAGLLLGWTVGWLLPTF
ncbi:hypothetical protein Nepgr_024384 [Nepenthes gracilis]|uniref:RAVE complex protein Rav1 C-terminal domain-containing protein n=1 Tax=Nepenthes gracilis TaxID=150966 RepID=A0AAD3T4L2_NEPGR|nr:hypothetical protein Nepgr_024384 [Nepenthes gracilis]